MQTKNTKQILIGFKKLFKTSFRRLLFHVTRASLSFPGTKKRNPGKEAYEFMLVEEMNPVMQNSFKRALVHAKLSVVPVFFWTV